MDTQNYTGISHLAREIRGSEIRVMVEKAAGMQDVISFAIGEPDFDTPSHIVEAAVEKLRAGATHYAPNPGIPQLRSAIAETYAKYDGGIAGSNVVVANGAQEAVMLALQALVDPGREIIVPTPHFVAYDVQFKVAGIHPIYVPTHEKDDYQLDIDLLDRLITPNCQAIMINSPRNPTGSVFNADTLQGIVEVARKHKLSVLSDEVYSDIVFDEPHHCILEYMDLQENAVVCSGFSKSFAMTGWRLGYTVSSEALAVGMRRIHEAGSSSTNVAFQYAAIEALKNGAGDTEAMRQEYQRRRDIMYRLINDIDGLSSIMPKGAFYFFVNVSGTGLTSREFADRLLEETHTIVVPGTAFGPAGEGYVRLSYAADEETLRSGMARIARFVESLK